VRQGWGRGRALYKEVRRHAQEVRKAATHQPRYRVWAAMTRAEQGGGGTAREGGGATGDGSR
jgi:hypothetical protein